MQQIYLISPYDGKQWLDDEIAQHTPIPRVRQLLGGRWERKKEFMPEISAYFNGQRRVLVMKFPDGTTEEVARKKLVEIREGREDRS